MKQLKNRLLAVIAILVLIAVAVSIGYNVHVFHMQKRLREQSARNTLQIYRQFLDDAMMNIESMLSIESQADGDLKAILRSSKTLERYLALVNKKEKMETEIKKNQFLDGMFLYDDRNKMYVGVKGPYVSEESHTTVKNGVEEIIYSFENEKEKKWMLLELGNDCYLVRMLVMENVYFCAWMKPEHLLNEWEKEKDNQMAELFLLDGKGKCLDSSAHKMVEEEKIKEEYARNEMEIFQAASEKYGYKLMMAEESGYRQALSAAYAQVCIILALGVGLMAVIWWFTKEIFLAPVDHMLLKKELEKNESKLHFLQLQINPHFLNNCLSLVRNLILFRQYDEAENAVLLLGKYSRNFLQTDILVTIREEMERVRNYYELQRLRMDAEINMEVFMESGLEEEYIPVMLIGTFVENAIKHHPCQTDDIYVIVDGEYAEDGRIKIQIADNGEGYPEEVLEKAARKQLIEDEDGVQHIGIYNILERLQIIYGDGASIMLENGEEGGALVTITIPPRKEEAKSC